MQNKIQIHCRVLSLQGCRSCQKPAPVWASHRVTNSFRHPPALSWVFHRLQVDPCFPIDLECLLLLLIHQPCCLQSSFLHVLTPAASAQGFLSLFLNPLSQRGSHHCWWAQHWVRLGAALALTDVDEASGSFSQKTFPCPYVYHNPAMQT